jgi:hypothetical protein
MIFHHEEHEEGNQEIFSALRAWVAQQRRGNGRRVQSSAQPSRMIFTTKNTKGTKAATKVSSSLVIPGINRGCE